MEIYHSLEDLHPNLQPLVLTIGNFDGIHKGHQVVLNRLLEVKQQYNLKSALITFQNHPVEVLLGKKIEKILTPTHKIKLFEAFNIDYLFLLPFTLEFSELSAQEFIKLLLKKFNLKYLLLGHDSTIGKNRHGNKEIVQEIVRSEGLQCEYVDPFFIHDHRISSSLIKEFIKQGNLKQLQLSLGRPYSIIAKVIAGRGKGKVLGYPTANLPVEGLSLPPYGVYAIYLLHKGKIIKGVANLGVAPTLREDQVPVLEVFLFGHQEDLYGEEVEVVFLDYIRREIKFADVFALQKQIAEDINQAHVILDKACEKDM